MDISLQFFKDFLNADSDSQEAMLDLIGDTDAQYVLNQLEINVLLEYQQSFNSVKYKGFVSNAIAAH